MNEFIRDNAEFKTDDFAQMVSFLAKQEQKENYKWFTENENLYINDIHFHPVIPEPLMSGCHIENLERNTLAKYKSSEEAFTSSMYCPTYGLEGSSQLMEFDGMLYPVGVSAIKGVLERAGIKGEGYNKLMEYDPMELSKVLNSFFKASKGTVCVLVQDEKVRAVNSSRYGICPILFVAETTIDWIQQNYPNAQITKAYTSHEFSAWTVDLSAYTDDILAGADELKKEGFTPAVVIQTSNTLSSSVTIKPSLIRRGITYPVGMPIACPHLGRGNAEERSMQVKESVVNNFGMAYAKVQDAAHRMQTLKKVVVKNSYYALLRAMKSVGMPKIQGMEAAEIFQQMYYGRPTTALECYLAIADAFAFVVRDNPDNIRKQFEVGECVTKAMRIDWEKLGNIPGEFSW